MARRVSLVEINNSALRLTRSAEQLAVFKIKKKKKCKHKEVICHIPLPFPPRITVWSILDEEHAKKIKDSPMPVKKDIIRHICDVIYEKKKERRIMRALYHEVLRFCLKRNYHPVKIATLFGMYHATHQFFTSSLWHDYEETYEFFKETVFVHSINDPPESVQIFSIVDVKTILLRFTSLYLPVLPLLRETVLPNVRLWMYWHECKPEISLEGKDIDMSGCKFDPNIYTGRSDWDPWDFIEDYEFSKDEDEDDERHYVYDTKKLDLYGYKFRNKTTPFGEGKNSETFDEEEAEEKELTSGLHEDNGEEEGIEYYQFESHRKID